MVSAFHTQTGSCLHKSSASHYVVKLSPLKEERYQELDVEKLWFFGDNCVGGKFSEVFYFILASPFKAILVGLSLHAYVQH